MLSMNVSNVVYISVFCFISDDISMSKQKPAVVCMKRTGQKPVGLILNKIPSLSCQGEIVGVRIPTF